jgi:predicted AlkP superfamily phosphohydrolase/phosphomutase
MSFPRLPLLLVALLAAPPAHARVVLVGIDGGSWNLLDAALARGELPHLSEVVRGGVTARLATVEPVNSPTVWTSIATGRSPEAHGIKSFYATRLDVRVPTTFERLAARGLRVGLYDWLVAWPPQALPGGFAIPGWLRRSDAIEPADAFARAGLEPYAYSMDGVRSPEQFAANCRRELAEKPARFVRMAKAYELEIGAVTFYALDAASHRFWDDAFPGEFAAGQAHPDPRFAGVIGETLRGFDRALGEIARSLAPDDTLLVVSDHGFRAESGVRRVWEAHLPDWLARAGLDPARDGFEIAGGFAFAAVRVMPGPFAERERTVERLVQALDSARAADGAPLYTTDVLDVAERPPDAARPLAARLRQLAVRAFLWWYDVELPTLAHAYVFGTPQAEALDSAWPEGTVTLAGARVPVADLVHPHEFSGGHDPTGIFLATGHGIRALPERADVSVLDLAPLLFYLSGQPIPDDLEGRLPEEILSPEQLAARPPRHVAAAELPGLPATEPAKAGADERAIRERLRSLGYAE